MVSLTFGGLRVLIVFSAIVSLVGALYGQNFKGLLIYSSVFARGWMLAARHTVIIIFFLVVYSISLLATMASTISLQTNLNKEEVGPELRRGRVLVVVFTLNIAGLPPMMGFISKIIVVLSNLRIPVGVLIMSAGVLVYIYLQFFINSLELGGRVTSPVSESPRNARVVGIAFLVLASAGFWAYQYKCILHKKI